MPGENFPGDRIVSLVDELEGLIEEAKPNNAVALAEGR